VRFSVDAKFPTVCIDDHYGVVIGVVRALVEIDWKNDAKFASKAAHSFEDGAVIGWLR
jgi:hypothetical protein